MNPTQQIPPDAVIAPAKLADYLLAPRSRDDKSRFLAQAGFLRIQPETLEIAIRSLAASTIALADGNNEYGEFWRIEGALRGPNGRDLPVVLIYLRRYVDGRFQFVTLKPAK